MKCWYSASNAEGSRLIIVVVHLGAVKTYVAAVEVLRKKERQDETQFTTKIDGFLSFIANVLFCRFFKISPCVWPNSGFWCCVFLTLWITLLSWASFGFGFHSSSSYHRFRTLEKWESDLKLEPASCGNQNWN